MIFRFALGDYCRRTPRNGVSDKGMPIYAGSGHAHEKAAGICLPAVVIHAGDGNIHIAACGNNLQTIYDLSEGFHKLHLCKLFPILVKRMPAIRSSIGRGYLFSGLGKVRQNSCNRRGAG